MEKAKGQGAQVAGRQVPCGNEQCEKRLTCNLVSESQCERYTPDRFEEMVMIQDCR